LVPKLADSSTGSRRKMSMNRNKIWSSTSTSKNVGGQILFLFIDTFLLKPVELSTSVGTKEPLLKGKV